MEVFVSSGNPKFFLSGSSHSKDQEEALSFTSHFNPLQAPLILHPESVRQGTFAMNLFALTALATSLFLPIFIDYSSTPLATSTSHPDSPPNSSDPEIVENGEPPPNSLSGRFVSDVNSGPPRRKSILSVSWLTLPRAWTASHILTSVTLLSTALIHSRKTSTVLVGLLGVSWALTQWAPFALISAEITKEHSRLHISSSIDYDQSTEDEETGGGSLELQAGTIMGVHNMAIATPQIVAAVGSSGLFWILGRWGIIDGEATGWVLRVGGLAGFVAAWLAAGIENS